MSIDEKNRLFFRGASFADIAKAMGVPEDRVREVHEAWLRAYPAAEEYMRLRAYPAAEEYMPRFQMTDIHSNVITLRDSSLASQAAVRIYVEDMYGAEAIEWVDGQGWRPMPVPKTTGAFGKHAFTPGGIGISMHLNRDQARSLGAALLAFANEKEGT